MKKDCKRTEEQARRWRKAFRKKRKLHRMIMHYGGDIVHSDNFNLTRAHIQHGSMTVHDHCMAVAESSLVLCGALEKFGIRFRKRDLVRGALLHDYFLYDWHDPAHVPLYKLHGFHHPGVALRNAKKEYRLTPRQEEIIKKHMWPLTVVPPTCREAWVVTTADKWCSFLETLHFRKGHGAKKIEVESRA